LECLKQVFPNAEPHRLTNRDRHIRHRAGGRVLDVRLLDLLAEVEAMLRSARDVQRNAIRMRGTSDPITARQRRALANRIRQSVTTIDRESSTLRTVARQVVQAAADLQSAVRANTSNRKQRASAPKP
jgi:hypothetical protein